MDDNNKLPTTTFRPIACNYSSITDSYLDSNLDWSFATLTPQMVKILNNDQAIHYNRRKSIDAESRSKLAKTLSATIKKISTQKALRISLVSNGYDIKEMQDVNGWTFDIFQVNQSLGYHIMLPMAKIVFQSHDLMNKFHISDKVFIDFVSKVERHYRHNPFHNSVHATDVMQTVNSIMVESGFINLMNDLEVLCILITALVHDIEHTGTNNNFHRNARSEMAKLYMVSILENHHLRVALGILQMIDLLAGLTESEFEEFKDMLCSMILSTDMGNHFLLLTNMKLILHAPIRCSSRIRIRRIMLLLLHAADISNPAKPWDIHKIWVSLLCQEFFDQGEKEKKMNLPISPNCDKHTANIAALQLGFMQTFCRESFEVLYTLIDRDLNEAGFPLNPKYQWLECMTENAENWNKNWSSLKFAFINDLLSETANPRKSVMGEHKLKKRHKRWCCCCCPKSCGREKRFYNLEYSSNTL